MLSLQIALAPSKEDKGRKFVSGIKLETGGLSKKSGKWGE